MSQEKEDFTKMLKEVGVTANIVGVDKLTNLLKNSIGGNCHTVVISNIWPEELYTVVIETHLTVA